MPRPYSSTPSPMPRGNPQEIAGLEIAGLIKGQWWLDSHDVCLVCLSCLTFDPKNLGGSLIMLGSRIRGIFIHGNISGTIEGAQRFNFLR